MSNIFPYGPMTNMRPIQHKGYSADDIKRMNIETCSSCGAKTRSGVCRRCVDEVVIENELRKARDSEN